MVAQPRQGCCWSPCVFSMCTQDFHVYSSSVKSTPNQHRITGHVPRTCQSQGIESTAEIIITIDYIDRNVYNRHLYASLTPLYYMTQGARTMAVHRNPEMGINGCDNTRNKKVELSENAFLLLLQFHEEPSFTRDTKGSKRGKPHAFISPSGAVILEPSSSKPSLQVILIGGRIGFFSRECQMTAGHGGYVHMR